MSSESLIDKREYIRPRAVRCIYDNGGYFFEVGQRMSGGKHDPGPVVTALTIPSNYQEQLETGRFVELCIVSEIEHTTYNLRTDSLVKFEVVV
jgi:hypothetical protein